MLAFLRVFVFYVGFAALLTWGLFALGWADALELPGFEGSRSAGGAPQTVSASRPDPVPDPVQKTSQQRQARAPEPEPTRAQPPPEPPSPPPQPKQIVAAAPPPPAASAPPPVATRAPEPPPAVAVVTPEPRIEPQPAAPVIVPQPRAPEPVAPIVAPAPPERREVRAPQPLPAPPPPAPPAAAPVSPPPKAAPPMPRSADVAPTPPAPMPKTPPPKVEAAPAPPPVARPAAQPAPATARARGGPVVHRIAGFGPDGLMDQLEAVRRSSDDVACAMFKEVKFRAGMPVLLPRSLNHLDTIAQVLNAVPERRIEIGSKLGPGRPMSTDAKLRTDRANLIRENLIELGVKRERLTIDTGENFERVAWDVSRANGGRVQSIGICVYP